MPQSIASLSVREAEFLAGLASQNKSIFTSGDAQKHWGNRSATDVALHRLVAAGWLVRLEPGTYLIVPLEAGTHRDWTAEAMVIAPYLIQPSAVAYWSALHYWQLTEQVPRTTFVQSTKRKRPSEKTIKGMRFRFVTVTEAKFFGTVTRTVGGRPFQVTDREKTLIDAADRPDLSGGIVQLAQALTITDGANWQRLSEYLLRWPVHSARKRLGFLLEVLDIPLPAPILSDWQEDLRSGVVNLEPGLSSGSGRIVTRWQVRLNVDGPWGDGGGA